MLPAISCATGFHPQQPCDTDIEAGASPQQSRRSSNTTVGRLRALLGANANTQEAAASDLVQPLLQPEEPDQQDPKKQQEPLPTSGPYDPFPATTAARAAAAEVTRARSAAATRLHRAAGGAAVLVHSASSGSASASAGAAAGTRDTSMEATRFQRQLAFASGLSWIVNIVLLVAKLYAYWLSQSKAVLASAADSAVDLVSPGLTCDLTCFFDF